MNVEIGAKAALFPEKEFISRIFVTPEINPYSIYAMKTEPQLQLGPMKEWNNCTKATWFGGLKVLTSHKRGRSRVVSIGPDFLHNRRCFLGTLKGIISCFKMEKTGYSV
jgi:hypothetical protein